MHAAPCFPLLSRGLLPITCLLAAWAVSTVFPTTSYAADPEEFRGLLRNYQTSETGNEADEAVTEDAAEASEDQNAAVSPSNWTFPPSLPVSAPVPSAPGETGRKLADIEATIAAQQTEITRLRARLPQRDGRESAAGDAAFFVTYDSVLVQPIQSNSTAYVLESGYDHKHVLFPWKIEHSPRVQFGREAADGTLGWRVRYWQFRHSQSFAANDSNGLIPAFDEAIIGYLGEDGDITVGLDFIESGTFRSHIRTDVIDWELQRSLIPSVDLYAGLRYAKVAQEYGADTDAGEVKAGSEFRGLGPTVAMRFQHVLPVKTLSLFANARGALLYGQQEYSVVDDLNLYPQELHAIDPRSYDDGVDSFAGNAELQLGLQLTPAHWLAMRMAVEAQHYADVGGPNPTAVFVGLDRGISGDGPLDDDLSFLGLSASTELRW